MPKGYHDRVAFVDLSTGKVWYESFGEAFWRRYLGGGPSPPTFSSGTCPRGPTPWAPRTPSSSPPGSSPEPPSPARGGTPWPPKAPSPGGTGTRRAAASSGRSSRTRAWTPWWFWARRKLPSTSTWKGGGGPSPRGPPLGQGPPGGGGPHQGGPRGEHPRGPNRPRRGEPGPHRQRDPRPGPLRRKGGLGAVMGAKRLKAVSARAHKETLPAYHDPGLLKELARRMAKERMDRAAGLVTMGTVGTVKPFNLRGSSPATTSWMAFGGGRGPGRDQPGRPRHPHRPGHLLRLRHPLQAGGED